MADINQSRQWLVDPDIEVKKKWLQCSMQEKKSQIVRLKQDIEDLQRGKIAKLEGTIMMLEKELKSLEEEYKQIDKVLDI